VNAQLFHEKEFYPNVKTIKRKSYNGSGGGGYWTIAKLDTLGRTIEKESYRKNTLLARDNYVYNFNNDQLYHIATYNINYPSRTNDTISNYKYRYEGNRIVYQKVVYRNGSTVIQLVENKDDTVLIYQQKRHDYIQRYILKYQNSLLVLFEEFDLDENSKTTTHFEYFSNGLLKRRKIEREPEPKLKMHYTGGPGSDDESYEYKFDKSGRVKTFYRIIEKKKYKIATYKYYTK
jgi:hypothetical protein